MKRRHHNVFGEKARVDFLKTDLGDCMFQKIYSKRRNRSKAFNGRPIHLEFKSLYFNRQLIYDKNIFFVAESKKSCTFAPAFARKTMQKKWSVSSVGLERFLHTEEVESSNLPQTTRSHLKGGFFVTLTK